jgi:CARDB
MRRTLVCLLLVALAVVVPAFADAREQLAQPAVGPPPPPLKASLAACSAGATEDQRFAIFTGSMPAYRGTRRMAMKFDLFIRPIGTADWLPVKVRGLGRWQRSDPGRAGFVYSKRVEHLLQGNEYRVAVRFRWYQAPGLERRDRVRRTPVCRQPDQRPNLKIESLRIEPGADEASRRYVVTVVNVGRTAAEAFDLGLVTTREDVRPVSGLPAGERATVEILAPACPMGERVIARADIRGVVDESSKRDNRFIAACDGR